MDLLEAQARMVRVTTEGRVGAGAPGAAQQEEALRRPAGSAPW
jgi:hypothetical protein